jgi:hypothetical protein
MADVAFLRAGTSGVDVKQPAEKRHTAPVQEKLEGTVFAGGSSNRYINRYERRAAS